MGAYDVPLLIGAAAVVGYFILQNPDMLSGIFPSTSTGDTGEFTEGDTGSKSSSSSSGSPCGDLCRAKDCSGYKKQCTTGCVHCCSSGPNSPNCSRNFKSSTPTKSTGDSDSCSDGVACGSRCAKGWCNSYKKCKCSIPGGCARCNQSGSKASGNSSSKKGTNCNDLCGRRECASMKGAGCNMGNCTQCNCSHLCSTAQCGTFKKAGCSTSSCPSCKAILGGKAYAYAGVAHRLAYEVAQNNWVNQSISVS